MGKPPERIQTRKESQPETLEQDELAQELAKRIGNLIPQGSKAQVVAQVVSLVSEERFSGPIAHPRHLREYEEICPGAADRIISMAEGTLSHAQTIQSTALSAEIADAKAGKAYGFAALAMLILAAVGCVYLNHEAIAGAFLGAGVLGVIGQFIQGRKSSGDS